MVGFAVVGLPDKAVAESRERVRAAISAPAKSLVRASSAAEICVAAAFSNCPIARLSSTDGNLPMSLLKLFNGLSFLFNSALSARNVTKSEALAIAAKAAS
jgi:hypothetical protein